MAPVHFGGVYLPLEHDPAVCHKGPLYLVYHNSHFSTLVTNKSEQISSTLQLVQVPIVEEDGSAMLPVQFCSAADGDEARCVDKYLNTCTKSLKGGTACLCALGSAVLGSDALQELRASLLAPLGDQPAADGLVKVGAADGEVGVGGLGGGGGGGGGGDMAIMAGTGCVNVVGGLQGMNVGEHSMPHVNRVPTGRMMPQGQGGKEEEAAARADEKLQSLVEMTEPAAVSMEEANTDKSIWSCLQEHTKRKKKRKKKGHAGDVERKSDGSRPVEADGPRTKQPEPEAPVQSGIVGMKTTSSCKEEKKKRKEKRNKKGWQKRHETERKPLKAEQALKALWDSEEEHTAEHACAIMAMLIACRHLTPSDFARSTLVKDILKWLWLRPTSLQKRKKAQPKPANGGRKTTAEDVGGQCRPSKPAAKRRSLMGGSLRSLLRGLLLLSCCGALGIWLAPDVTTGPSSFATSALPSMQAASSGTLTPPLPRLEFTLETSSPFDTSSYVSHHHVLEASLPSVVISRVPKVFFFTMPAVPSDPPNTSQV